MSESPLLGAILSHAGSAPDALFATYHDVGRGDWEPVTRGAMRDRITQFAQLTRDAGGGAGDVVLLIMEHGPDAHAAFLGAMLAGGAPAFLPYPSAKQDHSLYWKQHRSIFESSGARIIVSYDALAPELAAFVADLDIRVVPTSAATTLPVGDRFALPPAESVALLQHSSGTTGLKKGVCLSHDAISTQLKSYAATIALPSLPVFATWLPLYHDMGLVSSFLLPAWLGAPIVSIDPFVWIATPRLFLDAIARFGATHAWLPNFAFAVLVRAARGGASWDLSSLLALISCSEPCKASTMALFARTFAPHGLDPHALQTCYAMAETVFAVSQSVPGQPLRTIEVDGVPLLSNGPALPGMQVRITRDGTELPPGTVGEIEVRAPFLFSGYHNNPAATAAAFVGDWYRTGDLGLLDAGEVFVAGRTKDLIIINGKNVMAHDVEAAVTLVDGVKPGRCVAFGRYSERNGSEELVVVAELDMAGASGSDVRLAINDAVLAEAGVACADIRLVHSGWLVKTTSGKTSRADNARKYAAEFLPAP